MYFCYLYSKRTACSHLHLCLPPHGTNTHTAWDREGRVNREEQRGQKSSLLTCLPKSQGKATVQVVQPSRNRDHLLQGNNTRDTGALTRSNEYPQACRSRRHHEMRHVLLPGVPQPGAALPPRRSSRHGGILQPSCTSKDRPAAQPNCAVRL